MQQTLQFQTTPNKENNYKYQLYTFISTVTQKKIENN